MRLSTLIVGMIVAVAVITLLLMFFGVMRFEQPVTVQGDALYTPANEIMVKGVVRDVSDFDCPVSEGELGTHLMLATADGLREVHLAPARIMRNQKFSFVSGDQLEVLGAKIRLQGKTGVIAREITRGNENFIIRSPDGKLLLVQ